MSPGTETNLSSVCLSRSSFAAFMYWDWTLVVYSNRVGQVEIGGQTIRRAGTKVKGTRRKRNSRKRGESET